MYSRREFLRNSLGVGMTLMSGESAFGQSPDLSSLSLQEAARLIQKRSISSVDLTRACLDKIERLNPKLNAFITVTAKQALQQAHEAESEAQRGRWRGPLHGVPFSLRRSVHAPVKRLQLPSSMHSLSALHGLSLHGVQQDLLLIEAPHAAAKGHNSIVGMH